MDQQGIRLAKESDYRRIAKIWIDGINSQHNQDKGYAIVEEEIKRVEDHFCSQILSQTDNFPIWVFIRDGIVVGWSALTPFHPTPHTKVRNSYAFVSTYVSRKERGSGIGNLLMEHTVKRALKTDVKYILGIQLKSNIRSIKMCLNNRFVNLGELPRREDIPPFNFIVHNVE